MRGLLRGGPRCRGSHVIHVSLGPRAASAPAHGPPADPQLKSLAPATGGGPRVDSGAPALTGEPASGLARRVGTFFLCSCELVMTGPAGSSSREGPLPLRTQSQCTWDCSYSIRFKVSSSLDAKKGCRGRGGVELRDGLETRALEALPDATARDASFYSRSV